ncbi:stage III sporulation protein AH [Mycoplasma sp. CAG:956]|nr:stage III sporulation protein AH [Mycoplasma sp. CAG:956]
MNKQNLWFITLFSIILVLSIYYISMPSNILEEYTNTKNDNSDTTVNEITPSTSLVALRVASDEELLNNINNLQSTITDKEKTVAEKNNAYEELMTLNENKGLEENIESKLKEKFEYDSFVKINKDQINIVISSTKHDKLIANNIIKEVQSMFDTKKYITIKFQ